MKLNIAAQRRLRYCIAILALILAFTASAFAQASPTPTPTPAPQPSPTPSLERQFFKNILRDQRAIWTSPFHLQASDARYLVPLGAATAAFIATDRRTAREVAGNNSGRLGVSRNISRIGSGYGTGGIAAAFYLVGRATGNARARETGLLGAEALIDTAIVSTALKAVTQRPRPTSDNGRGRFFRGGNSFPSGHTISAWSLATIVANEYRDKPLVKYGAYSIATAVSISRFTGRNHFLSDALVGSAIGYGIGRYVYGKHHDPRMDSQRGETTMRERSKWMPLIAPRYERRARDYGVVLAWSF